MSETQATWLTKEAYDRLKHELDELIANRPAIATEIDDARREEGDLRESSGYYAAREEQDRQEARIRQLRDLLRSVHVGEMPKDTGIAEPGMVLTVRYADAETETFLLATREEGSPGSIEVVSPDSPLGKSLLGAKEGESRQYELPDGGTMKVTLIKAEPYRG